MTVMIMGEALVDVVIRQGDADVSPGGSPANVALGLGRLGVVDTTLHTSLADDEFGTLMAAHLEASGVTVTEASWSADRTSSAVATIGEDGSASYTFDLLWDPAPPPAIRSEVFHTGSIATVLEPGASLVIGAAEAAKARGAIVTFDPNIRPSLISDAEVARKRILELVDLSDLVKLSDEDAGWLYPRTSIGSVLDALLRRGPSVVAITRGAKGSVLSSGDRRVRYRPAPVRAVDTIGAGDTFMAALIAKVLDNPIRRGTPASDAWMQEAVLCASNAAAVTVGRKGADLPWASEVETVADHL